MAADAKGRSRAHRVVVRLDSRERAALAWLVAARGGNTNAVIRSLILRAADQPTKEHT